MKTWGFLVEQRMQQAAMKQIIKMKRQLLLLRQVNNQKAYIIGLATFVIMQCCYCSCSYTQNKLLNSYFLTLKLFVQEWTILDCHFGIPLFDADANTKICDAIISGGLAEKKRYFHFCLQLTVKPRLSLKLQLKPFNGVQQKAGYRPSRLHITMSVQSWRQYGNNETRKIGTVAQTIVSL